VLCVLLYFNNFIIYFFGMPVKKTTTKKLVAKKATKKPVVKSTVKTTKASVISKKPTVVVKEKIISAKWHCSLAWSCKLGMILVPLLLVVNTILLVMLLKWQQSNMIGALENFETYKVWGSENYKVMQKIYDLWSYKRDQKKRLEAALDALEQLDKSGGTLPATPPTSPTLGN